MSKLRFLKIISIAIAFAIITGSPPHSALAAIYRPGETLNPNCLPTDINCGVATAGGGNVIPDTDAIYDIGSPARQWRDLYLSGNTLHLGGLSLSAGGDGALVWSGSSIQTAPSVTSTSEFKFFELAANGANYVGFKAPENIAANTLWVLPALDGTNGQVLSTNGSGALSWMTPLTAAVISLNGLSAPTQIFATGAAGTDFNIYSSGSAHTFNLPNASATARGLLTSVDWNNFNNKQTALLANGLVWIGNASNTATAVPLSGDAAIDSAGALTIASGAISTAKLADNAATSAKIADGSITTAKIADNAITAAKISNSAVTNAKLANSTIDFFLGNAGNDASLSNSSAALGGALTLNFPDAGLLARGLLTPADWTTFNSKESAIAAGAATQYFRGDKTWATLDTSAVPENGNVYYNQSRFDVSLAAKTTDNLAEGNNLYWTQSRFDNALGSKTTDNLAQGTANKYYSLSLFDSGLASKTTSDLAEGTNLYYTDARFDNRLAAKTTSDLAESANLYYTDARFDNRFSAKTTSNLAEGTNLYWTQGRFDNAFTVKTTADLSQSADKKYATDAEKIKLSNLSGVNTGDQDLGGLVVKAGNLSDLADISVARANLGLVIGTDILAPNGNGSLLTGLAKTQVGLSNVDNTSDAAKPISAAQQAALDAKENTVAAGAAAQYFRGDKTWATLDTSAVPENGNVYYNQSRFDASLAAKTTDNLAEGNNLYWTQSRFDNALGSKTTDNLAQGAANKYYSSTLFNSDFIGKTTDDLSEGLSNLYWTNTRFNDQLGNKTTDNVAEGAANKYYADARSRNSVSADSPLLYNSSTGVFSLPQSSGTLNGYLSSADWNIFNNKQIATLNNGLLWVGNASNMAAAVALSGDATVSNSGVLTIVNNAVTSAKILDGAVANADLANSAIGLLLGAAGTDVNISGTPASLGGALTLNIPDASATARGLITIGGQTIAGAKTFFSAPTFSAITSGSVLFADTAGLLSSDNANLFWDKANNRLGVGKANPGAKLYVKTSDLTSLPFYIEGQDNAFTGLSGWFYRRPVVIDNTANSVTYTNQQVMLAIDTASLISAGKLQSGCQDMRFTDTNGATALPYWIEYGCNTAATRAWVKVPTLLAGVTKTIYMYYNNPSASAQSAGGSTFTFFDDFPNNQARFYNTEYPGWTVQSGSWIIPSGNYLANYYGGDTITINSPSAGVGAAVRAKMMEAGNWKYARLLLGWQDANNYYAATINGGGGQLQLQKVVGGAQTILAVINGSFTVGTWYEVELRWVSSTAIEAQAWDLNGNSLGVAQGIISEGWTGGKFGAQGSSGVSMARYENYATLQYAPNLAAIVGAEEISGAPQQFPFFVVKNQTGNVGVGEANPGAKLTVSGGLAVGSDFDTTSVSDGNAIVSGRVGIGVITPTNALTFANGSTIDSLGSLSLTTASNGALSLISSGAGAATFDSGATGVVNIGTGASGKNITIGNITSGTTLAINAGNATTGNINFDSGTLYADTVNNKVGVGTISPSAKLDVIGSARFQQSSGADGAPDSIASVRGLNNIAGSLAYDQDLYGLSGIASVGGAASGGFANMSDIIGVYGKASVAGGVGANTKIAGVYGEGAGAGSYAGYFQGNTYMSGNVGIGTSAPSAALHIAPSTAAALQIDAYGGAAGNTGEFRLQELSANGANYTGFKSPDALAANVLYTLPLVDGASGQLLQTNGLGALTWATAAVSASYMPQLADETSQQGTNGNVFIYRDQLYAMGEAGLPVGEDGSYDALTPLVVPVQNGPSGWTQVVTTYDHSCALSNVGTVYCWGNNAYGQLGDGTTTNNYKYAKQISQGAMPNGTVIAKLFTNRQRGYSANLETMFALASDGKLYAWGVNYQGQIGDGSTTNRTTPVLVGAAAFAGKVIMKVSLSGTERQNVAAIDFTGQLYTWGNNEVGQLGHGDTTQRLAPTAVAGYANVADVIASGDHMWNGAGGGIQNFTVVLKTDGTVWSAGANAYGQLGDGSTTQRNSFVRESTLRTDIAKIYAGSALGGNTAMVSITGNLYLTGNNNDGQLGDNSITNRNTYFAPTGAFQGKVAKVQINGRANNSYGYIYILDTDGNVWAAGRNAYGQLGRGHTNGGAQLFGQSIRNTDGKKVIDARTYGLDDSQGAIILLEDGSLMTTGRSNIGQSGNTTQAGTYSTAFRYVRGFEPGSKSTTVGSTVPMNLLSGAQSSNTVDNANYTQALNWSTLSGGNGLEMNGAALTSGSLAALGTVSAGFTGNVLNLSSSGDSGSVTGTLAGLNISGAASAATGLKISNAGAGLSADISGAIAFRKGVDYSTAGATNDAPFGNTSLVRLTGANPTISGIAGGTDGKILTIMNASGTSAVFQNQNSGSIVVNKIITGTGSDLALGADSTISLQYDSGAARWRVISSLGAVGAVASTPVNNYIPQLMDASIIYGRLGNIFIYRNQLYSMGLGSGYPYGPNGDAQAVNMGSPSLVPVSNPPSGWSQVVGTYDSACALSNVGTVYCWGFNSSGQLGQGDTIARYLATKVTFPGGASTITSITTNANFEYSGAYTTFYAIDSTGKVWAWGANNWGQLGDGTTVNKTTPAQVGSAVWAGKAITKISASGTYAAHAAALDSTGQLYTWGYNGIGELGQGDTADRSNPTAISGFTSVRDVKAIGGHNGSAAVGATFVLKNDGTVWGAGRNADGELGDNTTTNRSSFAQAIGVSGITKIFAGEHNTAAVNGSGVVYLVGWNGYGQLGNNLTANALTYISPVGAFQGKVSKIVITGISSTGAYATIYILDTDGNLWSAGYNGRGQLGAGGTTNTAAATPGVFQQVIRNTDGSKIADFTAYGLDTRGGALIVLDNGAMMTTGDNQNGGAGNDVLNQNYTTTFKYVIGFEPGSKVYTTASSPSFSSLAAATAANTIDNANWAQTLNWSTLAIGAGLTLNVSSTRALDIVRGNDGVVARFTDANGDCDINPTAGISCASDISLKKNILTLDNTALEKVLKLNPITFNWKGEEDGASGHIGFIAQEAEQLFPELVSTNEQGIKSIAYGNFAPILTKAIQEIASLADNFKQTLVAWFGNAANGIGDFFAKKIYTEKICLRKLDGGEYCVNGDDLEAIMQGRGEIIPAQTPHNESGAVLPPQNEELGIIDQAAALPKNANNESLKQSIGADNALWQGGVINQEPVSANPAVNDAQDSFGDIQPSQETQHQESVPVESVPPADLLLRDTDGQAATETEIAPTDPATEINPSANESAASEQPAEITAEPAPVADATVAE